MKITRIAGDLTTYALQIISDMRPLFVETLDISSMADGMKGEFLYKDGQRYEVTVKPVVERKKEAWEEEADRDENDWSFLGKQEGEMP